MHACAIRTQYVVVVSFLPARIHAHSLTSHIYDRLISYITYHLGWKVDTGNVEHRNRLVAYINTRTHAHTQISGRIEVYMAMRYWKMYINRIKEHTRYHCTITVVSPRTLLVVSDDSTRTIVNKPIRTKKQHTFHDSRPQSKCQRAIITLLSMLLCEWVFSLALNTILRYVQVACSMSIVNW